MEFNFDREGYRYSLGIDLGDFDETALSLIITAKRSPLPGSHEGLEDFEITAEVCIVEREGAPFLVVKIADMEIFADPMSEILGTSDVMNRIPSHLYGCGDPFIGCLVRAGLSASIDQARRCWRSAGGDDGFRRRLFSAMDCVKSNLANLCGRAAMRAGWCIAHHGL